MSIKRQLIIIFVPILVTCGGASPTDKVLSGVRERDQQVRRQMMALTKAVTTEGREDLIDSLILTAECLERIDAENIAIVDSLLQDGLPKGLLKVSYSTIWLVIDHATLEKQEQHLPLVEQMAAEELICASDYATLCDRVAMQHNRPQRYGTQSVQFGTPTTLQLHIFPVEDPEQLDSLRATVGLSPIAEYLEQLTTAVGIEAKFIPSMTVEDINRLREDSQSAN